MNYKKVRLGNKEFYIVPEMADAVLWAQEAVLGGVKVKVEPPNLELVLVVEKEDIKLYVYWTPADGWRVEMRGAEKPYSSWGWVERLLRKFLADPWKVYNEAWSWGRDKKLDGRR